MLVVVRGQHEAYRLSIIKFEGLALDDNQRVVFHRRRRGKSSFPLERVDVPAVQGYILEGVSVRVQNPVNLQPVDDAVRRQLSRGERVRVAVIGGLSFPRGAERQNARQRQDPKTFCDVSLPLCDHAYLLNYV